MEGCAYCQKVLAMFERAEADTRDDRRMAAATTPVSTETGLSLTALAKQPTHWGASQWDDLDRHLRPWLPLLLRQAGLEPALADDLLAFIHGRLPLSDDQRMRTALPAWVHEFAQGRRLAFRPLPADVDEILGALSLQLALDRTPVAEPEPARRVRDHARRLALRSADELLNLDVPGHAGDPNYEAARSDLFFEAEEAFERGRALFR